MSIHTVGDSHSYNGWSGIIPHHVGPVLCYSFGKKRLELFDIRSFGMSDGDTLVFSFGEIDCRCHVYKHLTETVTYDVVIDEIINNYFETIKLHVNAAQIHFKNICVYNIPPPIERHNTWENPEYPYLGTDEERKQYALYFNAKLKEKCIENGYVFFDVYDKYADENGYLIKALSDDNVHIRDGVYIRQFIGEHNI
jgi:hypothetical protein